MTKRKSPKKQAGHYLPPAILRMVKKISGLRGETQSNVVLEALQDHISMTDMKTGRKLPPPQPGQQVTRPGDFVLFSDLVDCDQFADDESLGRAANRQWKMTWMNDAVCSCVHVNHMTEAYTGRSRSELLGAGWTELIHLEDRKKCIDNLNESFLARRPFCNLYRMKRMDDYWGWVLDQGAPRRRDGGFAGYIGTFFEVAQPGSLPSPEVIEFQKNYHRARLQRALPATLKL